ncbi:flavin-dependent monooxygenase QhpG [Govanella unica]|uniref:Uncharacterized protein n=1 Tax=Govanella unica TaxID=2975056 RepID=A0A9X3TW83_9PROT|nr:hypothetical protein [Govania unica]MDA5192592.1 hypothetical protein [Govania unica]
MSNPTPYDIAILGGGPAGALTASHLAARGYHVLLQTLPGHQAKHLEGLAPRAIERLRGAGIDPTPYMASGPLPRAAHWGGLANRHNQEALVDRARFDAHLLEDARAAGVTIQETRVTATPQARLVIEARGRQAPRRAVALRGPHTVALVRQYNGAANHNGETLLAAAAFGWVWAAFPGDGRATVQLIVDAEAEDMDRHSLTRLFEARLADCPELTHPLAGLTPIGPPRARDAGAVLAADLASADHLRIGDAAFAIDPLAGHGLYEAIGGARAAAAVAATLLDRPDDRDLAIRFHEARARDAFLRHARMGRDFYRMETRFAEAPFWRARRDWPDDAPIHASPLSAPPQVALMPANIDGYIEEREVIVTADHPRGILSIAGVALVPLLKAPPDRTAAELATDFAVSEDSIHIARDWLARRGLSAVPAR